MNDRVLVVRIKAIDDEQSWRVMDAIRALWEVTDVRALPARPVHEVLAEAVTACEIQAEVDGSAWGKTERDHWMNVAAQLRAMDAERSKP